MLSCSPCQYSRSFGAPKFVIIRHQLQVIFKNASYLYLLSKLLPKSLSFTDDRRGAADARRGITDWALDLADGDDRIRLFGRGGGLHSRRRVVQAILGGNGHADFQALLESALLTVLPCFQRNLKNMVKGGFFRSD